MFNFINKYTTDFFAVDIHNLAEKANVQYQLAKANFDAVYAKRPADIESDEFDIWYDEQEEAYENYEVYSDLTDCIEAIQTLDCDSWEELSAKLDILSQMVEKLGLDK